MAVGYVSCGITYGWPDTSDDDTSDWIEIEQVEEAKASAAGFESYVYTNNISISTLNMMSRYAEYQSSCDGEGCLAIELRIHKSRDDLNYVFDATWGTLSDCFKSGKQTVKSYSVAGESTIELNKLVDGPVTAIIEESGGRQTPIAVSYDQKSGLLDLGRVIVGSVRLSYTELFDTYTLTITPRSAVDADSENDESLYESTVVVTWAGDPVTHDIELPDLDGNCAGSSTVINPDDGDDSDCRKRVIEVDACDVTDYDEWFEQIDCPDTGGEEQ